MLSSLSLVFPAYNEEPNLTSLINQAIEAAKKVTDNYEIIIVNDGSKDNTIKIVNKYIKKNPHIRLINNKFNLGYGQTVWNGICRANKEWVFFSDADLQFDLKEISKLTKYSGKYDVVIGYRAPRKDPIFRLINAKCWGALVKLFFGLEVKDLDCAFKLFRVSKLKKLKIVSGGATFSVELLLKLKNNGLRFKEVPVTHLSRKAGVATGAKPSVIIRALKELLELRNNINQKI